MPMATAPSPNDLTRQQLDELDALLQRMLSLPLNPPDAVTPGPHAPGSPAPRGRPAATPPKAPPDRPKFVPPVSRASQHPSPRAQPLPRRPAVADDLPLWLWPADILTRAADALLGLFGPPGRFFRSGFGK